jgi:hypothetical protein
MNDMKLRQLAEFQASIQKVQEALVEMGLCAERFFDYLKSPAGIDDTARAVAGEIKTDPARGRPS